MLSSSGNIYFKPIGKKMLIQSLREMVLDGIVSRRDFQEVPPHVAYSLTELGHTLAEALRPLCEWGSLHVQRIETDRVGLAFHPIRWSDAY